MADDAQSIRSLNWRELFPFINLFRGFRIAIHPSKLVLGFALLFLLYVGGRVLDMIWGMVAPTHSAVYNEIDGYDVYRWGPDQTESFKDQRDKVEQAHVKRYKAMLLGLKIVEKDEDAEEAAKKGQYQKRFRESIVEGRNKHLTEAQKTLDTTLKANHDAKMTEAERHDKDRQAHEAYDKEVRAAQSDTLMQIQQVISGSPRPVFDCFFDYEARQFRNVVDSTLNWNWLTGIGGGVSHAEREDGARAGDDDGRSYHRVPAIGVVRSITNLAVVGPSWMLRYHFVYFILFAAWFLVVWAVFGGAIARIAAVHIARDEKISVSQALRFSSSKFFSFVFAPIIPLIIILVAGLLVGAGGLLMYIPWVGPILVGAFFILPLLAGFIMTLVATGTAGGFNLMYPTIAVEGSDSFDAISRSLSYIFARPWRMLFYTAVALIYGALCFLFVRYFVYVMLSLTHFFVQWFLWGKAGYYWPEIWPAVSDLDLAYRINFQALSWADGIGAFLIAMWVYIILTILAAFVISFYFSANTIIYYLMRREVDATELDDVYIEETEDDFTEVAAATAATTPAAAPAAAPAAPPAAPPT